MESVAVEEFPQPNKVPTTRLVVTESVYYQLQNENPTCIDSAYSRQIDSDEQVYQRVMKLTEEWMPLDHGWVELGSMLCIQNTTASAIDTVCVIEVGVLPNQTIDKPDQAKRTMFSGEKNTPVVPPVDPIIFSYIPKGEAIRIVPSDLGSLRLRSVQGQVKCRVTVFPE